MISRIPAAFTRFKLSVILVGIALAVVASLTVATSAKAWTTGYQTFCWGVVVGGGGNYCDSTTNGQAGYVTEVSGSGGQHSVCVRAGTGGVTMCSGGPGQGVYNSSPPGTIPTTAVISNNAAGSNTLYGSAFYCVTPGC